MASRIVIVDMDKIDPNPYRDLSTYPCKEKTVERLVRSISNTFFWEGVLGRQVGDRPPEYLGGSLAILQPS